MSKPYITYSLEPHISVCCSSRILKQATCTGMTPGGNPIYICSHCGKGGAMMTCNDICWCGNKFKGQHETAYRCIPMKDASEKLKNALASCGFTRLSEFGIGVVSSRFRDE